MRIVKPTSNENSTSEREDWYQDLVIKTELAEHGPVKGTMVIRPYGYAIWEAIQGELDRRIKSQLGAQNAYFPLFIPEHFIKREKEHVAGFSPELAVVTHAGGKKLAEPLIVRPTSETVIGASFHKWINSYRDLPLIINQWANVVRWELRTRMFLRTSEFLWQEGHSAHATQDEASALSRKALEMYARFIEEFLAIPGVSGTKSESERFAGAEVTYALEGLMRDGKALQLATSHELGQHFAKSFGTEFSDQNGVRQTPYQTSWGASTRLIGAIILAHSDERGLRLPPNVAPVQVVVVPIAPDSLVRRTVAKLGEELTARGIRFKVDERDETPGFKFNHWEQKGVPLRVEIGPRDVKAKKAQFVRRDTGEHTAHALTTAGVRAWEMLQQIHDGLFDQALEFRTRHTHRPKAFTEVTRILKDEGGFVELLWCGRSSCEAKMKRETTATLRVLPFAKERSGRCGICGNAARTTALFAKAY